MKPMPASLMQRLICAGARSILTPSAPSTSAAPAREESARLPCLATGTPQPATMKAAQVEMLNEPEASPPVPTMSMASAGAFTRSIFARIVVTAPVISSTVSPRTRNAINSAPICDGVASPDIMRSNAEADSSRVRLAPVATLARSALNSSAMSAPLNRRLAARRGAAATARIPRGREIEKILQDEMAVFRSDAFGMELHAMDRQAGMHQPHHEAVVGLRIGDELARHRGVIDHQRMITRGLERAVDAAEQPGIRVPDIG